MENFFIRFYKYFYNTLICDNKLTVKYNTLRFSSLKIISMAHRKLRMGMIGGGKDAFIGAIHRLALNMDGLIELCCGALSINPDIAKDSGKMLFLPGDRTYLNYEDMIKNESKMPSDKRIDFVTIVTPNFAH